jgi:hypothetical protein
MMKLTFIDGLPWSSYSKHLGYMNVFNTHNDSAEETEAQKGSEQSREKARILASLVCRDTVLHFKKTPDSPGELIKTQTTGSHLQFPI